MTEDDRGRLEFLTIEEHIEALKREGRPEDMQVARVLEDIGSEDYINLSKDGIEIETDSVMQGMLSIVREKEGLRFGLVAFNPRVTTQQLRPTFRNAIDELSPVWNPLQNKAIFALQQLILEAYSFHTLAAMIVTQGITGSGSHELTSVAFPKAFREIKDFSTEREKNTFGMFLAGSFLKRAPLG